MTMRRLVQGLTFWLAFLAAHAVAQTAPNRADVVARVDRACPGLVQTDHAFTDTVASVLHLEDSRWGRNGKRGNPADLSHDAIAYRDPAGPGGVTIVDIIAAAGSPDARPAWQDVTAATVAAGTIGAWVAPSGSLPRCIGGVTPPPPPPPPPPPDLTDVLVTLARIEDRLTAIENRPAPTPVDPVDLKARLDVLRVDLEQLTAWLRSRRVLAW